MGLYNDLLFDDLPKEPKSQPTTKPTQSVAPVTNTNTLEEKKSLYDSLEESKKEEVDFKNSYFNLYRVGQRVRVYTKKGELITRNGKVLEIVDDELMYVEMLDTHKDVRGNYLPYFVTAAECVVEKI